MRVLEGSNSNRKKNFMRFGQICPIFKIKKAGINLWSICVYKFNICNISIQDIYVKIGDIEYQPEFLLKKGIVLFKKYYINFYHVFFDIRKLLKNDVQNKVRICIKINNKELFTSCIYDFMDLKNSKYKNGPIWIDKATKTSCFFRQSKRNTLYFTVRELKETDSKKNQVKIFLGKMLSCVYPKEDMVLLFEKDSSRYEESASVLYEKLIDLGYKNIYFIFDNRYEYLYDIPLKYRSNIIYKGTLKHYIYFFKCKKFIGTEGLAHAIDLRIANKFANNKIYSKNVSYVFLQHGVMYMVSLDADMRKHFNKEDKEAYRVVISSKLEGEHFVSLGGYDKENLYLTGLPKFDRNTLNKFADKIVIMPTWRRWEYNTVRDNINDSNYFKMVQRMVDCVPDEYKEKIIVLPHPLFANIIKTKNMQLNKYIPKNVIYDEILKDTRLLITDYSSISYDAFYRGSNIIFYWEEKDFCVKQYGKNAKLMLTEEKAFGDVVYNSKDLKKSIKKNYCNMQKEEYIEKYKRIVEFHDGKNTDRVIACLKKDGIIK